MSKFGSLLESDEPSSKVKEARKTAHTGLQKLGILYKRNSYENSKHDLEEMVSLSNSINKALYVLYDGLNENRKTFEAGVSPHATRAKKQLKDLLSIIAKSYMYDDFYKHKPSLHELMEIVPGVGSAAGTLLKYLKN